MARFGRSFPVPRRREFVPGLVTIPGGGTLSGNFSALSSGVITIIPTSGTLAAAFSAGFSPEGLGTGGTVSATFSAVGQPAVTVNASGVLSAAFSAVSAATWFIPTSAAVTGNFSAGFAPEAIGVPSAVSASFVALLSPEAVGIPSGLVATFSAGYNPEGLGVPSAVSGVFSASGAGAVQYSTTASVTGYFSVQTPTLPKVSVPWNQPGNQFVKDILSFGLHANYRVYVQVGVPTAQLGNNGDYCFRPDGTAGARMYVRSGGSWSAIN